MNEYMNMYETLNDNIIVTLLRRDRAGQKEVSRHRNTNNRQSSTGIEHWSNHWWGKPKTIKPLMGGEPVT